jgi:hypothetical protein
MNIKAKSTSSGSSPGIILTKYVHDTSSTFGISVAIGPFQLNYSSSGSFDEQAQSYSFYY